MEIGSEALKNARGLAFLTSYTVGFFGGGTFSHGILIAKKPGTEQWGLPVAISGGGATAMFGLGYREDICMYLLESDAAVQSTFGNHSLKVRREEPARDSRRRQLENRVAAPRRNTRRKASAPPAKSTHPSVPPFLHPPPPSQLSLTGSLALGPVGRTADGAAYINMDKKTEGAARDPDHDPSLPSLDSQKRVLFFFPVKVPSRVRSKSVPLPSSSFAE